MTSETSPPLLFLESPSPRVQPSRPETHDHSAMVATRIVSGVWFQRGALRRRPASAPALIFIVRAECQLALLVCSSRHYFSGEPGQAGAVPIGLRHRGRGSKFSRRPQRSCPVEVAKLVNHVYCSAVRRRVGLGLRRERTTLLIVV